jgi:hypothetical protein
VRMWIELVPGAQFMVAVKFRVVKQHTLISSINSTARERLCITSLDFNLNVVIWGSNIRALA